MVFQGYYAVYSIVVNGIVSWRIETCGKISYDKLIEKIIYNNFSRINSGDYTWQMDWLGI